ncbi:MAG TPA: undecaprenyl-phosphate glucose phosphotransferase [Xanthobacteraceae bacterium]|jgi:Undecaprenyl-phosphate glucose phosphotransferase
MLHTAFPIAETATEPRRRFSISSQVIPGLMAAVDSVVILGVALISFLAVVGDRVEDPSLYLAATAFVWLVTLLLFNFAGLFQFEPILRPLAFADKLVIAFATTFLFLLAAAFSLKISAQFSRIWIGSFAAAACTATLVVRLAVAQLLGRLADRRVFTRNVVIAGGGEQARKLIGYIEKAQPRFVSVLGLFAASPAEAGGHGRYPVLGSIDELAAYARSCDVDDVILALPWSADEQIMGLMSRLRELPVNVYLASDLVGFRLPLRKPPDHFGDMPLVEAMGRPLAGWGIVRKAAFDYGAGFVLTVLLLPLMGLIALLIKLDSRGPVLFRQERLGFVNRVFHIYKFRTMRCAQAPEGRTVQATRNDPRVTRVGRFLRRSSLDELPQLFNVLNGSMSLVGPRPHALDHNEAYAQLIRGYFARHRVKPGMTGWAQVNGFRGETRTVEAMEARVKLDIEYAESWSLLLDLKIMAMTLVICLTGRNAY